jgi:hypothetical protein
MQLADGGAMELVVLLALVAPPLLTWALRNTSLRGLPGAALILAGFITLLYADKPAEHHGDALDAWDGIGQAITFAAFLGLVLYGGICLLLVGGRRRRQRPAPLPLAQTVSTQERHE